MYKNHVRSEILRAVLQRFQVFWHDAVSLDELVLNQCHIPDNLNPLQ
jgi:hypothetical protein